MFWFNIILAGVLSAVSAYLLGSISFAIIISRLIYKKDIRTFGSGNAGMTNILRTFGKGAAAATFAGDFFKGTVSVILGRIIFSVLAPTLMPVYGAYIAAVFAVVGHLFPLYFKFKGGKGVSVAAGSVLAIEPALIAVLIPLFLIVFVFGKMVSLSSLICALLYPLMTFGLNMIRGTSRILPVVFSCGIAVIIIIMHKENIKRIIKGTEYKFGQKKDK